MDSLFHEEPTPPPDIPAPARSGKVETLQQRLTRKVFEKIHEDMVQQATGPNKFIIQVTSSATCSDFLLARLTHPRNRMPHFVTSVHLHLGLPVTPTHCNINQCANVPVIPNDEHQSFHARGQINRRHTAVKEVKHHFFQPLFTSGVSRYKTGLETQWN